MPSRLEGRLNRFSVGQNFFNIPEPEIDNQILKVVVVQDSQNQESLTQIVRERAIDIVRKSYNPFLQPGGYTLKIELT